MLDWHNVVELGQIVTGRRKGRVDDAEITLFESQGIGIEDIALARKAYEKAMAQGVGEVVPDTVLG